MSNSFKSYLSNFPKCFLLNVAITAFLFMQMAAIIVSNLPTALPAFSSSLSSFADNKASSALNSKTFKNFISAGNSFPILLKP